MAKGKDKKHSKEEDECNDTTEMISEIENEENETPEDLRTIQIKIDGFRNIKPTFPVTELTVDAKFLDNKLGTSPKFHVTDDEIVFASHIFEFACNVNSSSQLDNLVTHPVFFTVTEHPGVLTESIEGEPPSIPIPNLGQSTYGMSVESAIDLYESFTGEKVDQTTFVKSDTEFDEDSLKKAKSKGKKKDNSKEKPKKIDKKSSKTKVKDKSEESMPTLTGPPLPTEPVVLGTATLDLVGLFYGKKKLNETLPLYPTFRYYDERMIPSKSLPRLIVALSIDNPLQILDKKLTNILSFTVESMYNIPEVMTPEMEYKTCTQLPTHDSHVLPIVINEGKYKTTMDINKMKFWPGIPKTDDLRSATKFKIDDSTNNIRNRTDTNINDALETDTPRIEWNVMKRCYFGEESYMAFVERVKKYRALPLEIYINSAETKDAVTVDDVDTKSNKVKEKQSVKGSKASSKIQKPPTPDKNTEFLHLMTVVDVAALLYPGVNKVRVACPITTYHEQEILKATGLENSFFRPKLESALPQVEKSDRQLQKGKKGKEEKKGANKGSKTGSPADEKAEKVDEDGLKALLPPQPVPEIIEPSVNVYNELGKRTFIIIEIELLRPVVEKRALVDLSDELQNMITPKPNLSKIELSSRVAGQLYRTTIRALTEDIHKKFAEYLKELEQCPCPKTGLTKQLDFLSYLRRTGTYKTYLTSITKATSSIVNDKFRYKGECDMNSKDYQNYIADVFVYLVSKMNEVLNEIEIYGIEQPPENSLRSLNPLLFYAKEASELCADVLADRYYLEIIALDERNADCWFHYAIFCLELNEPERAFECVKEALSLNVDHRYSLLLYGILQDEKENYEAAETCFTKVMVDHSKWLEGWGIFLMFYKRRQNAEGEELCFEMAKKYINYVASDNDSFMLIDDLAWTKSICPTNDIYYRTAIMLIKMRCFLYAECALACCINETPQNAGISDYLAAVICYYRGEHEHSLRHLKKAEELHGLDYATASLKGHVYLSIGLVTEAKAAYSVVLQSYNRPEDVHLVYVNMAVVLECQKDTQEARKILLLACKYSPTPYTWLAAGLLYYKQRDLISAEACMIEANILDNRLPEIWAYLTLINVQLDRRDEAELCYRHALKNNLTNVELLEKITGAIESMRAEPDE